MEQKPLLQARGLVKRYGRVTALNTGFDAATGDVLIRCDDDFEPSPGHVAAHVTAQLAAHHGEVVRGRGGLVGKGGQGGHFAS